MEDFDICHICMQYYGEVIRPRSLNCGHSFCSDCLNKFIKGGILLCPNCQKSHTATSALDFSINFSLEGMITMYRESQLGHNPQYQSKATGKTMPTPAQTRPLYAGTMSSKVETFIQEQKESTQHLLQKTREMKFNIHQYNDFLFKRKKVHEDLYQEILTLASHHTDLAMEISRESDRVDDIQQKGDDIERLVNVNVQSLDKVSSAKEALSVVDELDKNYVVLEKWNKNCEERIPDAKAVSQSEKSVRETRAALSILKANVNYGNEILDLSQSSLTIMDKVNIIKGNHLLTLESLPSILKSVRNRLEKGLVFAVQMRDGCTWCSAKLSMEKNKIHLHCLQDRKPPADALRIKLSDLVNTLKNDSVEVFMDLSWEGSIQGRIRILLSPDTPLAKHFRILCLGELGPSYVRTKFFALCKKGNVIYEQLRGGDYQKNNGEGGDALIEGLRPVEDEYCRKFVPGVVWTTHNTVGREAQFSILIGKGHRDNVKGIFGQVIEGLELLKETAKLDDIREVEVADCGVVLPL